MATLTTNRPTILNIVCICNFILLVAGFMMVSSPFVRNLGVWFPAIYGTLVLAKFAATVGVWYLKKWGVLLFSASYLVSQIIDVYMDNVSWFGLIYYAVASIAFICYYHRMGNNL